MGKETPELQLVPHELRAVSDALHRVQAVIEFDLKGKVLHANDNFLKAMGYTLEDIRGQHHRIFCEPAYAASAEYKKFWENLGKGVLDRGEY
jgi:methyl-accepting chemotaxis protein